MIWVLLAILGVPIWLVVGVLFGIGLSRRAFKQQPGVFQINVRSVDAEKWPRRPCYGRVVSDVLVLNRGLALLRTEIHAIEAVSDLEIGEGPKKPEAAVGRLLVLDNGSRYEVAVPSVDVARFDAVSAEPRAES